MASTPRRRRAGHSVRSCRARERAGALCMPRCYERSCGRLNVDLGFTRRRPHFSCHQAAPLRARHRSKNRRRRIYPRMCVPAVKSVTARVDCAHAIIIVIFSSKETTNYSLQAALSTTDLYGRRVGTQRSDSFPAEIGGGALKQRDACAHARSDPATARAATSTADRSTSNRSRGHDVAEQRTCASRAVLRCGRPSAGPRTA